MALVGVRSRALQSSPGAVLREPTEGANVTSSSRACASRRMVRRTGRAVLRNDSERQLPRPNTHLRDRMIVDATPPTPMAIRTMPNTIWRLARSRHDSEAGVSEPVPAVVSVPTVK